MRLLVHVAGEADLLLSPPAPDLSTRAERIQTRRHQLAEAAAGPEGPAAARNLLRTGTWNDTYPSTPAPSPLIGALDTVGTAPDLDVVVIGTRQEPPHLLDTMPIAQALADALTADGGAEIVRTATAITVSGQAEVLVVAALARYLGAAPSYRQALVTWGSGSTALAMGALTALSQVGIAWHLLLTSQQGREGDLTCPKYETIDPLEQLDTNPVVSVLVRWRMFAALTELARQNPPMVRLSDAGRDLVHQAAQRHDRGFEAHDCASLRALLADAVVRRDGTASLTVRRYITSRYEELLHRDQNDHPWAEDLLRKYKPRCPLGMKLGEIRSRRDRDPVVSSSVGLQSYQWLFGPGVKALQEIGKGSHKLHPPGPRESTLIGEYLSQYAVDGTGWQEAGLPEPPIAPADTVMAVWLAGMPTRTDGDARAETEQVGQQLNRGLPPKLLNYVGVEKTRLRAVIFGIDDGQGSCDVAQADAQLISGPTHQPTSETRSEGWVERLEPTGTDQAAIELAIERRLTRETGALLFVPTGKKPVMLSLLRAMRVVGARHGIPLFVRENAAPKKPGAYRDVHLWPAITGGDLPLLAAAEQALRSLELDVAWRLLAASAIREEVTEKASRLADTFASRQPSPNTQQARTDRATLDPNNWTTGLIAQRLELVNAALADARAAADRIRLLVLAADALEASVAATQPDQNNGKAYKKFRGDLEELTKQQSASEARPARILLLLNEARDRAPVTHGDTKTSADAVIADAAEALAAEHHLMPAEAAALPRDVSTLLRDAVTAAAERQLGQPNQPDSLLRLQEEIIAEVRIAIGRRRAACASAVAR